jgi:predicted SnoaL-like aldol condensation-catalyzing enzyme
MHRKAFALDFLKLASSGNVQEAYAKYIHPDFVHHNPYFAGDRASFMKGMEENHAQFPDKVFTPLHVLGDGDLVAVHGKVQLTPGGREISLIHLFRFQGEKIIEEWEAAQGPVENSPNKSGLF